MDRPRDRGFTLVELVVSIIIMTILMGAMTSAILIVSRATPSADDPVVAALAASSEIDMLAEDLRYATAFAALQPHAVQFTVPDRTGDGSPEEIRFEWSGVPSQPLRRQMNSGAWTVIVPSVHSLGFSFNQKSVTTTTKVTSSTTSSELLFSSFNGWSGVSPSNQFLTLDTVNWGSEYFTFNLSSIPAGARDIKISRLQLMLQKVATTGSITVGIYPPTASGNPQPAVTPIGTPATVPVSSLPTAFGWVDITMPSDVIISTSDSELVIVVKGTVANAARWRYLYSSTAPKDTAPIALWTANSGSTWQPSKTSRHQNDFPFYAYGTYETDSTQDVSTTTYYLRSVGTTLQTVGAASPLIATAVEIYSQPQVTP